MCCGLRALGWTGLRALGAVGFGCFLDIVDYKTTSWREADRMHVCYLINIVTFPLFVEGNRSLYTECLLLSHLFLSVGRRESRTI